jgi:methylmalonyl-CoA mutase cobalamin-binding subunit
LLGGLLTLGVIVAGRRRAGVITTPADVAAEVDQWLRPVVGLSGVTGPHSSYLPFARNLYAQLPSPRSGRILVVGASAESGSASITRLVAAGLREHSPVTVVDLSDAFSGAFDLRSRNDLDRVTVVLDGGSIATTPSLPDAAKEASQIIVVARIGRDVHDNVRVIAQLARRNGIPVTAVCTRRGFRLTKSRTGLHRETRNQHETSEVDVSSAG